MTGTLEGKVALVSGSGRGIGLAIAQKLADAGAAVIVNDLDADVAHAAADAIVTSGGRAAVCVGDVTAKDFGDRFIAAAVDGFGGIDIIVNNAGYAWDAILQRTTDEQWAAMIDVHLSAPFRIMRAAQPVISAAVKAEIAAGKPRGRRSVINISSIAALGGNAGQAGWTCNGFVPVTYLIKPPWLRTRAG